jgi:hypothetical protein
MELAFILAPILAFVLIRGQLDQRNRMEAQRMQLMEQALRQGQLDRHSLELLAQHVGGKPPAPPQPRSRWLALLLALGWLTLFAGIGVSVLGSLINEKDAFSAGILVSIIGFGLVTYPFALRELEARRAAH